MAVNTKKAPRRTLKFASLHDLEHELGALQAAQAAGTIRSTGNWTPAQNLQHCARVWKAGLDGFPADMKPPAWLKWGAQLLFKKRAVTGATAPAGIKLPPQARPFMPDDAVTFDEAMAQFQAEIGRTKSGERFTAISPIFGTMTHDQWQRLQLGHCQLHLGFIHPR